MDLCRVGLFPDMYSDLTVVHVSTDPFFVLFCFSSPHPPAFIPQLFSPCISDSNLESILLAFASAQVNSVHGDQNVCGSDICSEKSRDGKGKVQLGSMPLPDIFYKDLFVLILKLIFRVNFALGLICSLVWDEHCLPKVQATMPSQKKIPFMSVFAWRELLFTSPVMLAL